MRIALQSVAFHSDGFPLLSEDGIGHIYVAECRGPSGDRPLKIGYTKDNPEGRISAIQTGCPYPVHLLGVLPKKTPEDEARIHLWLAEDVLIGEWFRQSEKTRALIARLVKFSQRLANEIRERVSLEIRRSINGIDVIARKSPKLIYLSFDNVQDAQKFVGVARGMNHEQLIQVAGMWLTRRAERTEVP
jgi:hypothetical protein